MKIQLAVDVSTIDEALALVDETQEFVDLIEVGSPLVLSEGLHAVRAMKERFPKKTILADCKISDGAYWLGGMAYDAGADIVTVMATASDYSIIEHARAAHERGKLAEVDMMGIENIEQRAQELLDMDIDIIGMHASAEALRPGEVHINRIRRMLSVVPCEKACVANSLTFDTLERVLSFHPEIIVISTPILTADNKREAARQVREIFDRYRT